MNEKTELLIQQLEVVIEHCNDTWLSSGAGAVREAINIIKKVGREEPVYIGAVFPTKEEREERDARNSG